MITQQRCPICEGHGIVSGGFYTSLAGCGGASTVSTEQCKNCNGQGIVYVEQEVDKEVDDGRNN